MYVNRLIIVNMASDLMIVASAPKSMKRAKEWNQDVENAYRFQLAGYRDENEYLAFHNIHEVCLFFNMFLLNKEKFSGYQMASQWFSKKIG